MATKSPNHLAIVGWQRGFKFISFVKLLRAQTGWGLKTAKEATDRLLDGVSIVIPFSNESERDRFRSAAEQLGAVTESSCTE